MPPGLAGSQTPQTFQGCRARLLSIRCVLHPWKNLGLGLRKTHPYRRSWAQPPAFNPQLGASVCEEDCNTWGVPRCHTREVGSIQYPRRRVLCLPTPHSTQDPSTAEASPPRTPVPSGTPLSGVPGLLRGIDGEGAEAVGPLSPFPLLSHLAVRRALGARPKGCGGKWGGAWEPRDFRGFPLR